MLRAVRPLAQHSSATRRTPQAVRDAANYSYKLLLFTRGYKLHHMTQSQQEYALQEQIAICDYKVLKTETNKIMSGTLNPIVANMVTLADFRRNVKDGHNLRTIRRFKNTKKAKLQSSFCLLLHTLHYACLPMDKHTGTTNYFRNKIYNEIGNNLNLRTPKKIQEMVKKCRSQDPDLEKKVIQCLALYMYGDSTLSIHLSNSSASLSNITAALSGVLTELGPSRFSDLLGWISCIMASNVTDACCALRGQSSIPLFISKDILERTPRSDYEVELLIELYQRLDCDNCSIKILENLICSTKLHKHESLEALVNLIVEKEKVLSLENLNKLVFLIGERTHKVKSKQYAFTLIRCQRVLIDSVEDGVSSVNATGYFGMAQSLSGASMSRARLFLEQGQKVMETKEDHLLMQRTKLALSGSKYELYDNFNSTRFGTATDGQLWSDFFQLSHDFGALTERRSVDFVQQQRGISTLQASQGPVVRTLPLELLLQMDSGFGNSSICALISKLYQKTTSLKSLKTGADAARHVFSSLSQPTRSVVGEVLLGESYIDPSQAYTRFTKFVNRYCDGVPNEKCLMSLLFPALNHSGLKWENRKAPQLAVHEFRKAVKMRLDDRSKPLLASEELWRTYILLCGRCDYQYELTEVFEAWEQLRFSPDKKTLGMLLGAVPDGVGERIRSHGVKYLCPDTHDEIETDVWDWPSKKEIGHWRHTITKKMLNGN